MRFVAHVLVRVSRVLSSQRNSFILFFLAVLIKILLPLFNTRIVNIFSVNKRFDTAFYRLRVSYFHAICKNCLFLLFALENYGHKHVNSWQMVNSFSYFFCRRFSLVKNLHESCSHVFIASDSKGHSVLQQKKRCVWTSKLREITV